MQKQTGLLIMGACLLSFASACALPPDREPQAVDAAMQAGKESGTDTEIATFSLSDLKNEDVYQMADVPWHSSSADVGVLLESEGEKERESCELQDVEISELEMKMTAYAEFQNGELIGLSFVKTEKNPDEREVLQTGSGSNYGAFRRGSGNDRRRVRRQHAVESTGRETEDISEARERKCKGRDSDFYWHRE